MKKRIFLLYLILATSLVLVAQDSTSTGNGFALPAKVTAILVGLAAAIEILVRVVPTAKNWSVLSLISRLINAIIPNKKSDGTKFQS